MYGYRTPPPVKHDDAPEMDLSLLPPVCYLSRAFHRLLDQAKVLFARNRLLILTLLGVSYPLLLIAANVPGLGWPSEATFLIAFSPVFVPVAFFVLYTAALVCLQALFAAEPKTRLLFAAIVLLIVLLPSLVLSLDDTRLLMALGTNGTFFLLLLQLVLVPVIGCRAQHWLIRHSRWSTPVLLTLAVLVWFEGHQGFSVSRTEPRQVRLQHCESISGRTKGYDSHYSYRRCDVYLQGPRGSYHFSNMPVPHADSLILEIRHGIFNHYRLLPAVPSASAK